MNIIIRSYTLNLNHLAVFHAVAETGSISHGAENLYISQPAVSKQLSDFEKSLGTRLFDRLPRGVRLTESGELLLTYSRHIFALETEAECALAELESLERGKLSIGASTTIGDYLLPGALAQFHARHPGVTLQMEIANTERIQRRLQEGSMDVGFTEGFVESEDLERDVFMEDELVAIASPKNPIAKLGPISLKRLCKEPFILREAGSGTRAVLERELQTRGASIESAAMSLGSTEAIKHAVADGIGVAIVSRLTTGYETASRRLQIIPIEGCIIRRPLHCLHLRGRHRGKAEKAFLQLLAEHISSIK
jgi:DNA-binding transcriptional LysR family regulator